MTDELKACRFDPPGNWRWPCRFSLEELKTIYCELLNCVKVEFYLRQYCSIKTYDVYDVYTLKSYGRVVLEDGGARLLEACTKEELDWFLFIGKWFKPNDDFYPSQLTKNPLYDKLSREEALITLDLHGIII